MTRRPLDAGKLPAALLQRLLEFDGPPPADLLLPPAVGEDAGVIDIAGGALVAATDPITLTGEAVGAHAVVINANDVAVMGVRPRWFLAVILLPPGTTEADLTAMFEEMRNALDRIDVALVGGHTEVTPAVTQPVVVGQMLGYRADGRFIRTAGMAAGDTVIQVGAAPIEGAAVLAHECADRLDSVTPDLRALARDAVADPGISVVAPALRAADLGASALHDPTEGGLSAGLHELADASGLALRIDTDSVRWFAPGAAVCAALGADPWGTLASGALLAAFPAAAVDKAENALKADGYETARLGVAEPGAGVHTASGPLKRYEQDEVSRVLAEATP